MTLSRTYALASVLVAGLAVASATPLRADARSDAREQVEFGISVAQRGLWREAIYRWEKAVELDDSYSWAWRELAELRSLEGNHENAEAAFKKATELEPDEAINDGLKAFMLRCALEVGLSGPQVASIASEQALRIANGQPLQAAGPAPGERCSSASPRSR